MKPDRMIKYGAGIWKKWMRKVPKDMRWNEHDTRPAGRNTIKQCWIKQYNQEKNTVNHTGILNDLINHADVTEVVLGV